MAHIVLISNFYAVIYMAILSILLNNYITNCRSQILQIRQFSEQFSMAKLSECKVKFKKIK